MSRIFDALRKSEKRLDRELIEDHISPESFIETMEKVHTGLGQVEIAYARLRPESRLVVHTEPGTLGAERFRFLRAQLAQFCADKKFKTFLVTSPLPQDGKSLVCLNLATALARQENSKVLLLEGDLRQARLHDVLGIGRGKGLSECLQQGVDALAALRRIEPLGFFLLSAGQSPPNPVELLQSQRFSQVMQQLKAQFDWILVDSPPACPLADAILLKAHADRTILVVKAGVTPQESIEEAVQLVGVNHIIAVLLNGAQGIERSYYYYRFSSGNHPNGPKPNPRTKSEQTA